MCGSKIYGILEFSSVPHHHSFKKGLIRVFIAKSYLEIVSVAVAKMCKILKNKFTKPSEIGGNDQNR